MTGADTRVPEDFGGTAESFGSDVVLRCDGNAREWIHGIVNMLHEAHSARPRAISRPGPSGLSRPRL